MTGGGGGGLRTTSEPAYLGSNHGIDCSPMISSSSNMVS